MTTTLRPKEPEERGPDAARRRRYAVCVNSREAGEVVVGAKRSLGALVGEVGELRIDEADRRRGRGTVAALAAEEVLRQWGCERVEIKVPGGAEPALRLASALGYTEMARHMAKRLGRAPQHLPLPDGMTVRPMGDDEYPAWLEEQKAGYIRDWVEAGLSPERARAKAEQGYRDLLADGPRTPGTVLRVLSGDGARVGVVWVGLRGPLRPEQAWVYDVEVGPGFRGRGHGRTLMRIAEAECAAAAVAELGLNVFAANAPAKRLYESLGFTITDHYLAKPLL
ncbi:GNAT family N-acetyltransferase [Wenjunlia tyrosinilytica]|uniref:N-acetyltransferase n=1 Tax=Wenjunlia tyrosinilytica TaxID=1544741 RepID=A0A918DUI2_9ACTN|nr:GNAT family N-acetyltransferase [Wenjunlia tyrosinilytica]GGO82544.1 N-acetyltransferase [Wenjunlia tyrosinilytica]